ncbi:MAG TPA: exodeoxyribonuclease V subunit beta, partial [Pasteurellaceae bacterium]|nr:exodeoxyribonuclease V subunit beta [Pasteurellaceae bacterium]
QNRLPDYQYDSHFGGVIYAFMRGMNGRDAKQGVFFTKPSEALIKALEPLFYA